MIKKTIICIVILACITVVVASIVIGSAESIPDVYIKAAKNTNLLDNTAVCFNVENDGGPAVNIDNHYTIYWTNSAGLFTNHSFKLNIEDRKLPPSQTKILAIKPPGGAKIWWMTIQCSSEPNLIKRIYLDIKFYKSGGWELNNDVESLLSPNVVNTNVP